MLLIHFSFLIHFEELSEYVRRRRWLRRPRLLSEQGGISRWRWGRGWIVFLYFYILYFCIFVFLYFCFQLFRPNFCSAASPTNHSANPNSLSTHGNIPLELGKWKAWKSFVEKNIIYISMTSAFFSFATIILSRVNYTDDLVSISIFWISPYQQDENLVKLSWRPR